MFLDITNMRGKLFIYLFIFLILRFRFICYFSLILTKMQSRCCNAFLNSEDVLMSISLSCRFNELFKCQTC